MPLLKSPTTLHALGYILFVNNVRTVTQGEPALEFLHEDAAKNPVRHSQIRTHNKAKFLVYYKHDKLGWEPAGKNFQTLADTIPYLQSGIRVLIEYETNC